MHIQDLLTPFNLTLAILFLAAIFFMRGKVRTDLVAMCSLIALMLLDILTPAEALAGFSSSVVVMMIGLFIVGAGIFRTGLAKMISARILKLGGSNENLLFVLVMLVTAFIGAFVSNTGTVAVMMPIVISMAASSGLSIRRYLMPMAFASSMGMFTLISTPPNLVIQETLINEGYKGLSFFSFAPVGAVAVVVGVVCLFFLSRKLIVSKEDSKQDSDKRGKSLSELVEEYDISTQMFKISVPADSPLVDQTMSDAKVATTYLVSVVKIIHKNFAPRILKSVFEEEAGPDSVFRAGDVLYCVGSIENIQRFADDYELKMEQLNRKEAQHHFGNYGIAEVFVMPDSDLINHTVREARFRELFNVTVLGIKRQGDYKIGELKDAKIHSGDALLIQGTWDEIAGLADRQGDLVLVGQPAKEAAKVTLDSKAPIAALIMLAMIVVMVMDVVPAVTAVLTAAVLMVVTGCIRNMEEAYSSINWNSIVLIGAMIPMSTAFDKTGITEFIANTLMNWSSGLGPHMLLVMIYVATSLTTLFVSNTATAILFAPIAMKAAITMNVSPYPLLFAVAVAASMCFASPFSTPPNALVMSAGKYTFMDYVRVGLPLQVIMAIVMILVLPFIFPF